MFGGELQIHQDCSKVETNDDFKHWGAEVPVVGALQPKWSRGSILRFSTGPISLDPSGLGNSKAKDRIGEGPGDQSRQW